MTRTEKSYRAFRLLIIPFLIFIFSKTLHAETYTGLNGAFVQTAMDAQGDIHMVYVVDGWMSSSYYTKYDGSGWTTPTFLPNSSPCWLNFTKPAVAVGPDGLAQVAYGVYTGDIDNYPDFPNSLDYFFYAKANDPDGSNFDVQQIGPNGYRHSMNAIAVDDANRPHISYTRTSKSAPWFWEVVYFTPDTGTHRVIQHATEEQYRPGQPRIAYGNGVVYIAWFQASSPHVYTDVWCASYDAASGVELSYEKVSNAAGSGLFAGNVDISVAPDGHAEISYLVADWEAQPHPIYLGVYITQPGWSDGYPVGEGSAWIDEEHHEEFWPNIDFDSGGNRYLAWYYYSNNETYYKINSEPRHTMEPWGSIDVAAGVDGAYYVRAHGLPGPLYMEQIATGGPVYYPPTAEIANIGPNPVRRGLHLSVSFEGSAWDNDESGQSITSWEWNSSVNGLIGTTEDFVLDPIDLDPARHTISFKVQDDEGEWSSQVSAFLRVLPDTVPPFPVESISVSTAEDTVTVTWSAVVDNLAMSHYEIHRGSEAWFVPEASVGEVDATAFPLVYEDDDALNGADAVAYYTIVPVDIDDNTNTAGSRAGAFRFETALNE